MKEKILADEPVNTGRQAELDLARALPVMSLPFVHCVIECTPMEKINEPIPFLFNVIIGAPLGAPIFMFAMGICIMYTRNNGASDLIRRGIHLFLGGFLLNFMRFFVPYMIGYILTGETEKYITPIWYKTFGNDILQFAGLSLILIGLFKKTGLKDYILLIIAIVMSLAGWYFRNIDFGNQILNISLGHFIGTSDPEQLVMSYFPVLNWFIVPVSAYMFGKVHVRIKDKKRFYLPFIPLLAVGYWIYFALECSFRFGKMSVGATIAEEENAYYHVESFDALAFIICAVGMLGVYYIITLICPEPINKFFYKVSRNINRIYVIHWLFVVMTTNVVLYIVNGTQELPIHLTMLLGLAIFIASYFTALFCEQFSQKRKERKIEKNRTSR